MNDLPGEIPCVAVYRDPHRGGLLLSPVRAYRPHTLGALDLAIVAVPAGSRTDWPTALFLPELDQDRTDGPHAAFEPQIPPVYSPWSLLDQALAGHPPFQVLESRPEAHWPRGGPHQVRAWGYCRMRGSFHADHQGRTQPQRRRINAYRRLRGLVRERTWTDWNCRIGSPWLARPGGERLWRSLAPGDHVVVSRLDRAGAGPGLLAALLEFARLGVTLHAADRGPIFLCPATLAILTELRQAQITEQQAQRAARARGEPGPGGYWQGGAVPIGYRLVPAATRKGQVLCRLAPCRGELEACRIIYSLADCGLEAPLIVRALDQNGRNILIKATPGPTIFRWTAGRVTLALATREHLEPILERLIPHPERITNGR